MKTRLLMMSIPIAVMLTACQPTTVELTEVQKAEIVAEVQAVVEEYTEAWEAVDLERGMAFTLDSPETMWVGGGRFTRNSFSQQEENIRQSAWSIAASADFTYTDEQYTVLAPDVVAWMCVGSASFTDTAGLVSEMDFTYTYIWVHRDGEWKVLLGHGSYP